MLVYLVSNDVKVGLSNRCQLFLNRLFVCIPRTITPSAAACAINTMLFVYQIQALTSVPKHWLSFVSPPVISHRVLVPCPVERFVVS